MGVPLSLGFVGLLLLAINALALDTVALVVISAVFSVLWLGLARGAYRGCRVNLQRTLTRRDNAWVVPALEPLRDDPDLRVRTAVDIALVGAAGDVERTRATRRWAAALAGDDPDVAEVGSIRHWSSVRYAYRRDNASGRHGSP